MGLGDWLCDASMGPINPQIICPHCGVKGQVRFKMVKQKKGLSGGKVAGAICTAGLSMLATGLSRKEKCTQCKCENCESVWFF